MLLFKFTGDEMVKRLRWLMAATIIFSMANTLAGQPTDYWNNPAIAIRGDGLSISNPTNHTFEFFLGSGWVPFTVAALVYLAAMFLLASVLPRKLALVFIFSTILGHYYGASNWLAVHWHLGMPGPMYLGSLLVALIVFAAFPSHEARHTVKTARWIMLFAILADATVTLIGQPAGYWHDPALVYEGNAISKFFLLQGWYAYALEQLVIGLVLYRLTAVLSSRWALVVVLNSTFSGFIGSSNWLFYNWRFGWPIVVAWGSVLSLWIVFSIFRGKQKHTPVQQLAPPGMVGVWCRLC